MKHFLAQNLFKLILKRRLSFQSAFNIMGVMERMLSRKLSPSGRLLRRAQIRTMKEALNHMTTWTSVLFPAEILYPFGLRPLPLEVLGAVLSTVGLSPYFLNIADGLSAPPAMCSFHRLALGLSKTHLLKRPLLVGATSILCDGNVKSFAQIADEQGAKFTFLDVPYYENDDSIKYLRDQLINLVDKLCELTGIRPTEDDWKRQAKTINRAIGLRRRFFDALASRFVNLYRGFEIANSAFTFHSLLGTHDLVNVLARMCQDVERAETFHKTKRFMWLHIVPQYPTPIWGLIDDGVRAKIVCDEYSSMDIEPYDEGDFFGSVARRLIRHPSNGPMERRISHILDVARRFKVDGIIHYSSWGCHQAAGNIAILEQEIHRAGIPIINLSGDATDPRNASSEQHRTRIEAFIEQLQG